MSGLFKKLPILLAAAFLIAALPELHADPSQGGISGSIGFPSDAIPPLLIVAFQSNDPKKFHKIATSANQATFSMPDLPPGSYLVVGYTLDSPLRGGYTKAVPCGLEASCTDHSLIPVKVEAGKVTPGVELKDWYAPDKAFPPRP